MAERRIRSNTRAAVRLPVALLVKGESVRPTSILVASLNRIARQSGYRLRENADGSWSLLISATGAVSVLGDCCTLDQVDEFLMADSFP